MFVLGISHPWTMGFRTGKFGFGVFTIDNRGSACSLGWPQNCDFLASASQGLRLQGFFFFWHNQRGFLPVDMIMVSHGC